MTRLVLLLLVLLCGVGLLAAVTIRRADDFWNDRGAANPPGWVSKLFRQPNLLLGVVAAFVNMLVLLGVWDLTGEQTGGVNMFFAALVALIAFVVTPSQEVAAYRRGTGPVKAGPAAEAFGSVKGDPVRVTPVNLPRSGGNP